MSNTAQAKPAPAAPTTLPTTAASLLKERAEFAEKREQWEREMLMERVRISQTQRSNRPSFSELAKGMRNLFLEGMRIDHADKLKMQNFLDAMQDHIKVNSKLNLSQRLESVSRKLGLKFTFDNTTFFISSDVFFVEIRVKDDGIASDVLVHHECKETQQSCSELITCLNKGDFADLTQHLEGYSSIYQLNAESNVKAKAYLALESLENDIVTLYQINKTTNDIQELLRESMVGVVLKRRGGHHLKFAYFVSPLDMLLVEEKQPLERIVDSIIKENLGFTATVTLEASSANKLQILPRVSIINDCITDGKEATYAPLNAQNSIMMPATYVLRLNRPLPVCHASLCALGLANTTTTLGSTEVPMETNSSDSANNEKNHTPTTSTEFAKSKNDNNSTTGEQKDANKLANIMTFVVHMASEKQIEEPYEGLVVHIPDQTHCYFFTENTALQASTLTSVPFTDVAQLPKIIAFLKHQALFYTLLSSCVRPNSKLSEMDQPIILEVNAVSFNRITVSLQHPHEYQIVMMELEIYDNNVTVNLFSYYKTYEELSVKMTKIAQRCLSIPLTVRALIRHFNKEHKDMTENNITMSLLSSAKTFLDGNLAFMSESKDTSNIISNNSNNINSNNNSHNNNNSVNNNSNSNSNSNMNMNCNLDNDSDSGTFSKSSQGIKRNSSGLSLTANNSSVASAVGAFSIASFSSPATSTTSSLASSPYNMPCAASATVTDSGSGLGFGTAGAATVAGGGGGESLGLTVAGMLKYNNAAGNNANMDLDFHESPKSQIVAPLLPSQSSVEACSLGVPQQTPSTMTIIVKEQEQQKQFGQDTKNANTNDAHKQQQQQQFHNPSANIKTNEFELADKYKKIWKDKTPNLRNGVSITPIMNNSSNNEQNDMDMMVTASTAAAETTANAAQQQILLQHLQQQQQQLQLQDIKQLQVDDDKKTKALSAEARKSAGFITITPIAQTALSTLTTTSNTTATSTTNANTMGGGNKQVNKNSGNASNATTAANNNNSSSITITPISGNSSSSGGNTGKEKNLISNASPLVVAALPSITTTTSSGVLDATPNVSSNSSSSKRSSKESDRNWEIQKEKRRKKKRDDSPMGPPEKVYSRQNSPAANSEAAANVVARKFSSPSSSPKGGSGGLSGSSSALSMRPSPKHSPVYNSPKHTLTTSSPKSPYGTHSPKHGSSGKPSMSTLKSAAATSLSPKNEKSSGASANASGLQSGSAGSSSSVPLSTAAPSLLMRSLAVNSTGNVTGSTSNSSGSMSNKRQSSSEKQRGDSSSASHLSLSLFRTQDSLTNSAHISSSSKKSGSGMSTGTGFEGASTSRGSAARRQNAPYLL